MQSQRRNLQRTFSDESLTSSRRDPGYPSTPLFDCHPTSSDLLFSCTLPNRRHNHLQHMTAGAGKKGTAASATVHAIVDDKVSCLKLNIIERISRKVTFLARTTFKMKFGLSLYIKQFKLNWKQRRLINKENFETYLG